MWDLPGPGLEPVSPALAGGFLTTAPPGKSGTKFFILEINKNVLTMHVSTNFIPAKKQQKATYN